MGQPRPHFSYFYCKAFYNDDLKTGIQFRQFSIYDKLSSLLPVLGVEPETFQSSEAGKGVTSP